MRFMEGHFTGIYAQADIKEENEAKSGENSLVLMVIPSTPLKSAPRLSKKGYALAITSAMSYNKNNAPDQSPMRSCSG
jgi:hypothetical protein